MPMNPRVNPKLNRHLEIGDAAIGMGSQKLGEMLSKCLDEARLIQEMPDMRNKDIVARKLYANLSVIMGIPRE